MRKRYTYKIVTCIVVALAIICTAFFWIATDFSEDDAVNEVISLNYGWYYIDDTGEKIAVSLPCKINADNTLELFYDGTEQIKPGYVLATNAAVYDVEIYAGEQLIYQFKDNGREVNNAVRGNIVCFGAIPETSNGLRIVYHSSDGKYKLSEITLSTERGLLKSVFMDSLFCLIVSIAMLALGLLAVAFDIILGMQKERDKRILCIALYLIACGLWCLSDSAFVHFLEGYSYRIFTLDFYLFMAMPIPLSYFVLNTEGMNGNRMLHALPFLYYINIVLQSLLAAFGVFTFFRMLYVTHFLMMFCGVISSLYVLIRKQQMKKTSELSFAIRAIASVGVIGTVAIVLYEVYDYSTYQLVYQTGLLLLMSILLTALLKEFMQSVRYRTEAIVYKRLSEQDRLTKLKNRRSFDALLEKMGNGSVSYENAVLIFMDVNFLKRANDSFGHVFGDELLINAAHCISNSFGNIGYCYRIGGDEFCAVILDPSYSESELIEFINAETKKYNLENHISMELSIACGCSFIVENGNKKTINEWMTQADNKMYEAKKQIKALRES